MTQATSYANAYADWMRDPAAYWAQEAAGITDPELLPFTAGGYRDVTRIAAGDCKNPAFRRHSPARSSARKSRLLLSGRTTMDNSR